MSTDLHFLSPYTLLSPKVPCPALRELDFSKNRLTAESSRHLSVVMGAGALPAIEILNLRGCLIGKEGARYGKKMIKETLTPICRICDKQQMPGVNSDFKGHLIYCISLIGHKSISFFIFIFTFSLYQTPFGWVGQMFPFEKTESGTQSGRRQEVMSSWEAEVIHSLCNLNLISYMYYAVGA